MDKQGIDLFIKQLTYLPFREVINMCQSNSKFHNYCTLDKYNDRWKALINHTFGDIYGYQDKLEKIWKDLNYDRDRYDYMVYTNLVKYLDPITQLMIYYRQGDMDNFNNPKYQNIERFLSLFLLRDEELVKYLPKGNIYQQFMRLYNGETLNVNELSELLWSLVGNRDTSHLGNVRIVKYLVSQGANVNHDDNYDGLTPLIYASRDGHLDIVKYLVSHGANVNPDDNIGFTPLSVASSNENWDIVKYLVEHGANVNYHANNYPTPLIYASEKGHLEIVKYLVEHGADVNYGINGVLTPLILASIQGHLEIVKYLQEHGAH